MEKEIVEYVYNRCRQADNFDSLCRIALNNIDKYRCPLYLACIDLDRLIFSACEDWEEENGIEIELDTDEIFFSDYWVE